jgi:hypothetical protein
MEKRKRRKKKERTMAKTNYRSWVNGRGKERKI